MAPPKASTGGTNPAYSLSAIDAVSLTLLIIGLAVELMVLGLTLWLLFQTLVGLWPAQPPDEAGREDLRQRVQAYMRKAIREAKLKTTWVCPEGDYEDAVERYIDGVLRVGQSPFADELGKYG